MSGPQGKAGTEASSHLEQPTFCWRRSGPSRDLWGPKLSEDLEVSLVEGNTWRAVAWVQVVPDHSGRWYHLCALRMGSRQWQSTKMPDLGEEAAQTHIKKPDPLPCMPVTALTWREAGQMTKGKSTL